MRSAKAASRSPRAARRPVTKGRYLLRLYVAGARSSSIRAIANIKALCEEQLRGRYTLEIIDLYQQAHLARSEMIVAVPTLIRRRPLPIKRLIGELSDRESVLRGLDIAPAP